MSDIEIPRENILERPLANELQRAYADYASYVISDRALPDARDGLKPVHRRILWAMYSMGLTPRSSYKKSARIVGEVTGKFHPHSGGVYEALVRLAQPFSLRYPLVDGQGNFGSIDGFPAAAMRYTEARLASIALEILADTREEIVPFQDNFDGEEREPIVLSSKIPNLLLNGASGIAVGMSSNIPPHHLGELLDACIYMLECPRATSEELMQFVKGPDFPTGGTIIGREGIVNLYTKGVGKIVIRSKVDFEPTSGRNSSPLLVIKEIPYMVNKSKLVEEIHNLIENNRVRGIKDVRDLSKNEIRIELPLEEGYEDELSRKTILGQLFTKSSLQITFYGRILAFVRGRPRILTLSQALQVFLAHRETVVRKRTEYELKRLLDRLEIVEGLIIASDHIDEIIRLIRSSDTRSQAHDALKERYGFSDRQAKAVLDMPLSRLPRLEQEQLRKEKQELEEKKARLELILNYRSELLKVLKEEFEAIKEKYADRRRTDIVEFDDTILTDRPLIHLRNVMISITKKGYIRSISYEKFRTQGRGGKGVKAIKLKEDDQILDMVVTTNHHTLLLLTKKGVIHTIPAWEIPLSEKRTSRGTLIDRFIPIASPVIKIIPVEESWLTDENKYIIMVTKRGIVNKTRLSAFKKVRRTGIIGTGLQPEDSVVQAIIIDRADEEIFIASKMGKMIRFDATQIRETGRSAIGVKGMSLDSGDVVVDAFAIPHSHISKTAVLVVTEHGYGKMTPAKAYRKTNRGGKGVKTIRITHKNGPVIAAFPVPANVGEEETIALINSKSIMIRIPIHTIRLTIGRITQGVKIMNLSYGEKVVFASSSIQDLPDTEGRVFEIPQSTSISESNPQK